MNKAQTFQRATFNVQEMTTYADVINAFNELNRTLNGEHYAFHRELKTPDSQIVPGFSYSGYVTGVGLRNILDKLGIKYTTHIKSGSGIGELSEILIHPESEKTILDLVEKCGEFRSNIFHGMSIVNSNPILLQKIK